MKQNLYWSRLLCAAIVGVGLGSTAAAQHCVTQSQMQALDRDALVKQAQTLATLTQANDANAIKAQTVAQYAQDFSGIASTVATAAPHLQGATFQPSTLWILDARDNKTGPDGTPADVQFFCNRNKTAAATTFGLPALPAGRYALAILDTVHAPVPWQLALLMKESTTGTWQLAGIFPRATTAAGHDGVWYWTAARTSATTKHNWNAWLEYSEAEQLLKPVEFVTSTHLDQLHEEQTKAAPAALSAGISSTTPLVIKARDGKEYQLTALAPDDSLGADRIDVAMHYKADAIADPVAARARNQQAASALLAAYPEMRTVFHGVWVYADSASGSPFASEEPVTRLP